MCSAKRNDWDERVSATLWAYHIIIQWLQKHTPFQLVYGLEAILPIELTIHSLFISQETHMTEDESIPKSLEELW